jgi:hypothetical protein
VLVKLKALSAAGILDLTTSATLASAAAIDVMDDDLPR